MNEEKFFGILNKAGFSSHNFEDLLKEISINCRTNADMAYDAGYPSVYREMCTKSNTINELLKGVK